MTLKTDLATLNAILRNEPYSFLHQCCLTLNPGARFLRNWHLEAIIYQMERV